ncbi:MAG: glycosyltransferase family 2 protein [Alphaproteobacteria bacterium]|nr:glycosyltransferase family 2 protein [Alphaproteobacteria bacterium]
MPTANRRRFVPEAIRLFLAQDYSDKELVIVDNGGDTVSDLMPADPRVRYVRARPDTVGALRNIACEEARGELIAHWDDDDFYAPSRLSRQARMLAEDGTELCGLNRFAFYDRDARQAWEYRYPATERVWVHGATMGYRKSLWRKQPFPTRRRIAEDTDFCFMTDPDVIRVISDLALYVGLVHRANSGVKDPDLVWRMMESGWITEIVGTTGWAALT